MVNSTAWFTVTDMEDVSSPAYSALSRDARNLLQALRDVQAGNSDMSDLSWAVGLWTDCQPIFTANSGTTGGT